MAFSAHESKILDLLQHGLTNKKLARDLGLSPHTVRDLISGMMRLTGVTTRVALAALHARAVSSETDQPPTIDRRTTAGDRRSGDRSLMVYPQSGQSATLQM